MKQRNWNFKDQPLPDSYKIMKMNHLINTCQCYNKIPFLDVVIGMISFIALKMHMGVIKTIQNPSTFQPSIAASNMMF